MPVENMEEEGLARIPDLNIAQWIFTCKTNPVRIPYNIIPFSSYLVKNNVQQWISNSVCL